MVMVVVVRCRHCLESTLNRHAIEVEPQKGLWTALYVTPVVEASGRFPAMPLLDLESKKGGSGGTASHFRTDRYRCLSSGGLQREGVPAANSASHDPTERAQRAAGTTP